MYVDQNPSYIYKNPPMQYNQNGIAMPLPDKNAIVNAQHGTQVKATFVPHGKY